ncbi:multiple sugar transport system permease protein [Kibdelosporangium banguiense]|uniref:Multiple sugar transport system permease protein n=1 Tax=Kibdelosporangium banguiense TaxID=1365924 RepID=A0ABS4TU85_9PSEU|nr:sugar ABC transporter permease [Kibdelosporangium banguiense]MBP2327960.1 multiple sugar transport system permease protein [Kibdelosporangium banguiense]
MSVLAPQRAPSKAAEPVDRQPRRRGHLAGLLLAAPFAILLLGTVLVPVLYALYLSLFTERLSGLGFNGPEQVFVWLGNYIGVLSDKAFHGSLGNVALFVLVHIPIMLGGALVLALLLDSAVVRLRRMWSLAVFLPYAVPVVIGGLIWAYLYSPGIGPLAAILPFDPLSDVGILPSVVNIATWQWIGYNMIIFYTALQAVPRDVIEAAHADGAGPVRAALSIKVPMIRPSLFVALVFTVIGSLQLFTEPMVLRGFTGSVSSAWTPSMYVYEAAFIAGDSGRAAAASVLLAVVCALLSAVVMRVSSRRSR